MTRSRIAALLALGLLAACSGDDPAGPESGLDAALIVSDAVPLPDDTGIPSPSTYTFVSLPSGAIPGLTSATVRNRRTGATATALVVDGGIDPVPVPASTGDTVDLTGTDADGGGHELGNEVKGRVPPVVVRSEPGRGATDAPTLLRVKVTFSEPVAVPTVTAGTVKVLLRDQEVAGTVVLSSEGLFAEFIPEDSLVAGATYTVVVTRGVEDRTGDSLGEEYRIEFTVAPYGGPTIAFASVATGLEFSCATARSGAVYCWGQGAQGQLGIEPARVRRRPSLVTLPDPVTEVSAGIRAACVLTVARLALCWGTLTRFLSLPPVFDPETVFPTPTALFGADPVLHAMAGGGEMCALQDHGLVSCATYYDEKPGLWLQDFTLAEISLGWTHECWLTTEQTVFCDGDNGYGQLGNGTTHSTIESGEITQVVGGLAFTAVTTGLNSTCGLVATRAYCWGWNAQGGLGIGSYDEVYVPTAVLGDLQFSQLEAGYYHTCGLALDGMAYCWGDNRAGQLGDGTRTQRNVPVPVQGGLSFRTLSASADHTCGITVDDVLYCWGGHRFGQLGDGSTASAPYPIKAAYQ